MACEPVFVAESATLGSEMSALTLAWEAAMPPEVAASVISKPL
jgi:hypothetical protein